MDVRCDRCETEYELEDSSVSDAGTSVQCTTCGHRFVVTKVTPAIPTPQPQVSMPTPAGGNLLHAGPEPGVPEWTLSSDDGKVHRFRDLNTLQKWIVERKVSRSDRLSRAGGPWLALSDMEELTPFFNIVDQADRPRVARTPTRPNSTNPSPSSSSPNVPRASSPTPQPPPVPSETRRTVSPDGPTVPNRRLPDARTPEPTPAGKRPSTRTPGLGMPPAAGQALGPGMYQGSGLTTPAGGAKSTAPASRGATESSSEDPPTLQMQMPTPVVSSPRVPAAAFSTPSASGLRRVAGADSQRSIPPIARPTTRSDAFLPTGPTEDTGLTSEFVMPDNRRRNAMIAAAVVTLAIAGGGYALWSQQTSRQRSDSAATKPTWLASPPSGSGSAANPPVAGGGSKPEGSRPEATRSEGKAEGKSEGKSEGKAENRPDGKPEGKSAPSAAAGASTAKADNPAAGPAAPVGAGASKASEGGGARARGGPKGAAAHDPEAVASTKAAGAAANYERLVAEADRLLEHGQAAKAEKLYTQALAAKPEGVAALTGIAYVLLDRQRHFKAIETFRRVLEAQPNYGPALFGIAESYRARGDSAQALAAYRQYLSISPSGADAPAARRQIKDLESGGGAASAPSAARKDSEPAEAD